MEYPKENKGANILINTCGAVKIGETVLIATDQGSIDIAEILFNACLSQNMEPTMLVMAPRHHHGEEPPKPYALALLNADVIFAPTTFSLFHTNARIEANKNGARWVNLPGFSKKMLKEGGLFVDFHKQRSIAEQVGTLLTESNSVRVTTIKGTDITFSIMGREAIVESGISDKPGMVNSPPDIEVCIAPVEGTAEGTIVIDGSIVLSELGPLKKDVILQVTKGSISKIEGNEEAELFKSILAKANEEAVYNIGEFGIGLNPECKICGSMLEDEGVYGTIHFGIGDNHTIGGTVEASMHTDVVITQPTVVIDKRMLIEKGEIVNF